MKKLASLLLSLVLSCGLVCSGALADDFLQNSIHFSYDLQFHDVQTGYGYMQQPSAKPVEIYNDSNQAVTLHVTLSDEDGDPSLPNLDAFDFGGLSFTDAGNGTKQATLTVPAGTPQHQGKATFTVRPRLGLSVGDYAVSLSFRLSNDTQSSPYHHFPIHFSVVETAAPRLVHNWGNQLEHLGVLAQDDPDPSPFQIAIKNLGSADAHFTCGFSGDSSGDKPFFTKRLSDCDTDDQGRFVLAPGSELRYGFWPNTNLSVGEHEDAFTITYADGTSGAVSAPAPIVFGFTLTDDAMLAAHDAPPVHVNAGYTPEQISVEFKNFGKKAARIIDVDLIPEPGCPADAFQLTSYPEQNTQIDAGDSTVISIMPAPGLPVGPYHAQINVTYQDVGASDDSSDSYSSIARIFLSVLPAPAAADPSDLPQTGDPSALPAWLALLGMSGLALKRIRKQRRA